jgi:hypothetical protein
MSSRLVPCLACHRHVRVDAESCPFCFAERTAAERVQAAPEPLPARMSSLAVMTFRAAALGVALNACGGEADKPKPSGQGGSTAQGGANANSGTGANAGTPLDTDTGGATASGGRSGSGGSIEIAGAPNTDTGGAGPVPVYRATPRG